jgi:hypothetical protein
MNVLPLAVVAIVAAAVATAQTPDATSAKEHDAIRTAVLDYPLGWYAGDGDRMKRRLHPALAKRAFLPSRETKKPALREMTAEELVSATASGRGTNTPPDQRRAEVVVLDVFENVASVKIIMQEWIDYAHVAKIDGEWKIVNVLWEPTPEARKRWFGG